MIMKLVHTLTVLKIQQLNSRGSDIIKVERENVPGTWGENGPRLQELGKAMKN